MELRGKSFLSGFCLLVLSTFDVQAQIGMVDRDAKMMSTNKKSDTRTNAIAISKI